MEQLKIRKILELTNGKLLVGNEEELCENFSKDTRKLESSDTYIGIKGETFNRK